MSQLIYTQSLTKSYGARVLFKDLECSIFEKDRIGLIGPNGAGKSTLLKILCQLESPDSGNVVIKKDLRVGYVPQESVFENKTPFDILLASIRESELDAEKELLVHKWLTKIGFSGEEKSAKYLSGGWKKRLSIAKAMIHAPDVLLLDEPTNHLDLESILWLETFLQRELKTFLVISHDRSFLENVTSKIIEINPVYPGGLFSVDGSYRFFQEKKERFIEGQLQQEKSISTKVRKESEWLKTSPKARTTKSKSRIDQADEIFAKHKDLKERNKTETVQIDFASSNRQTRKLLTCVNLKKIMGDKTLFASLDVNITAGLKLGLMGSNGSGKTTLMRLFAGEIEPDMGTIKRADDLKIVYFDQQKEKLPPGITLKEALSPDGEFVRYRGEMIHVNGFCKRFLFSPDLLSMSIDKLSGGERARISIARLMLREADILLLDEPTNDLDIPTLEILEKGLIGFPGAVILISHDRSLLDQVCNQFLSLHDGRGEFFAEYAQFENLHKTDLPKPVVKEKKNSGNREERKERSRIEKKLEQKEKELQLLEKSLESQDLVDLQKVCKKIEKIKAEIDTLFEKWAELEEKL